MDLLGSILGSMEKPPTLGDGERKKAQAKKKQLEKFHQQEKDQLSKFRNEIQKKINGFIKDNNLQKFKFEPMERVFRAIVHEVAEVAGLASFSFGEEEVDRYILVWKKEFAPSDDELAAYRRGEEWDPEKFKEITRLKELEQSDKVEDTQQVVPATNYQDKYERIIGRQSAKDAARMTSANRSYGNVPSENKRDQRTIEQVLAETGARKKLKTEQIHDDGVVTTSAHSSQDGVVTTSDNHEAAASTDVSTSSAVD